MQKSALLISLTTGAIMTMNVALADVLSGSEFVRKASIANQFEIETSKVALDKAQDNDVKKFAQQMVDEHTKTGEKMKDVLAASNSELKPEEGLDAKHQELLNKLQSASNDNFDSQYTEIQTQAHKEAVSLFGDYAKNGQDTALKNFASETLPALEQHLKHVQQLNPKG